MSLRTSLSIALAIGFGNALNDTVFEREKDELLDTLSNCASGQRSIAANGTDVALPMDGITTGRLLYIEADREFSVKLNGTGNTATSVKRMINPAASSAESTCAYYLVTAEFTSVHISNPSATDVVKIKYCMVGDLA